MVNAVLKLHPELESTIKRTPRLPFHIPWLLKAIRPIFNLAARTSCVRGVRTFETSYQGIPLLVAQPKQGQVSAGILWFHGGAHLAGRPDSVLEVASRFALELNAVVAIPKYRLAPDYPFPADIDDAFSSWQWLLEFAQQNDIAETQLAIAGNSAGGGIAASLAQRIQDAGGIQPAAQVLFYPMLDDRTVLDKELSSLNHFVWNNQANAVAWRSYLAPYQPGADSLPEYAAPARRQDLSGLPPMWLGVAGIDLFKDECLDYIERFQAAGGECQSTLVEGAPHAFEVLVPKAPVSKAFVDSALNFLKAKFSQE